MTPDRWKQKIAAYLAWPPDRALAPGGAEGRAAALVEAALGEQVELPLEAARKAAAWDAPLNLAGDDTDAVFAQDPKVVHPLSGAWHRLDLGAPGAFSAEAVSAAVERAVTDLRGEIQNGSGNAPDPERLFLKLWRRLPDKLRASSALPGGTWDLLPADPRFPSLSTWHHASAASALAGAGETPALLLFTLGSPQAFVTTSRRTQDYWMGSFLISYLMWQGMQPLADACGPDAFLYPNLHGQPLVDRWLASKKSVGTFDVGDHQDALKIANFPNVFTALVPHEEAKGLAGNVEQAIRDAWDGIGRSVKAAVEKSAAKALGYEKLHVEAPWSNSWDRQLKDFPDRLGVFWAVCPWGAPGEVLSHAFSEEELSPGQEPNQPGVVHHVRALLEWIDEQGQDRTTGMGYALLANLAGRARTSRKALRDFPQAQEKGWKCSLCGERRALHPGRETLEKRYGSRREEVLLRRFWEDLSGVGQYEDEENNEYQKLAGRIRAGDRLCAVCLTKRLALDAHFSDELGFCHFLFPSTATLATAPFKAYLLKALSEGGKLADTISHYTEKTSAFLKAAGAFYPSSAVPALEKIAGETDHDAADWLLRLDGEWLYEEEAFDPDKLRREYDLDAAPKSDLNKMRLDALNALGSLLEAARPRAGTPSRYYAILSMDGDKMGDRVSGKNAPFYEWMLHPKADLDGLGVPETNTKGNDLERPLGPGTHLALSGVLKNFALRLARFAVEDAHRGKLIFAGGDDTVALLPINDLLPAMRLLRAFFQGMTLEEPRTAGGTTIRTEGGFGEITEQGNDEKTQHFLLGGAPHVRERRGETEPTFFQGPTASIGVAIVHESDPLVPSIEEAEEAMKESAKEGAGRNAFAVHLLKRSGAPLHMAAPFFPGAEERGTTAEHDVLEYVAQLAGYLRDDRFSPSLARDLLDRPFGGEEPTVKNLEAWVRRARRSELHRLARRRTPGDGDTGPIETLDALLQALHVAEEASLDDDDIEHTPPAWRTLAHLIRFADFLATEAAYAE